MTDLRKEKLKKLATILRIVVGVGLIIFLFWRFDINKVLQHVRSMDIRYLVYALVIYFVFIIIAAWRWQVLLNHKNFQIPFGRTMIIYFISLFFNNLLPTTVGGDVMRVLYIMKDRKTEALATILVDRILGFVGLFIFAFFAVLYPLIHKQQTEFLPVIIIGLIIIVLITYVFFSARAYAVFSPVIHKLEIFGLGERLNRLHEAGTDFGGAWGLIILCIIQSIIIQSILAIVPFLVMKSLGNFNVGLLPFFIYIPIINVISMIPISIGALGVRENSYVLLFSRVGLPGEISLTISLVSFVFVYFLCSLIGVIFFIFYKKR